MNNWKCAITLATCCCVCLAIAASASADFVGVTTVNKDDPDVEFLCVEGNGDFVSYPLTVCNVFAVFDYPENVLLSVGNVDLQVYGGQSPEVFYQHPFGLDTPYDCFLQEVFPDLLCDSYVTIGNKCNAGGTDGSSTDVEFDSNEFNGNGHIIGGWFNSNPANGQGVAGTWPNLQVLFLQSSVMQTLHMSGVVDLFWAEYYTGDVYAEVAVPVECPVVCLEDYKCDDGDPCTQNDFCSNHVCAGTPIDCDDGNVCTDDACNPEGVCVHTPNDSNCADGNPCTDDYCDPAGGCVNMPNNDPCDDGDLCTVNDQCGEDGCVHGTPIDCSDGNECTEDSCNPATGECNSEPIDCDDGDQCTDDACDPDTGCTHEDTECPEGQVCDPASGECVEDQDPCECVNGRVTLCHIPPGQIDNAHTITVGCAARDKHLAHGDICGPCE